MTILPPILSPPPPQPFVLQVRDLLLHSQNSSRPLIKWRWVGVRGLNSACGALNTFP